MATQRKRKIWLWTTFSLFLVFIALGVLSKRVWGHREWLIPLHFAGGVCLFLWAYRYYDLD